MINCNCGVVLHIPQATLYCTVYELSQRCCSSLTCYTHGIRNCCTVRLSLNSCAVQVFDYWPQSLSSFARKNRTSVGFLVGRWGTPVPRKVCTGLADAAVEVTLDAELSAGTCSVWCLLRL